MFSEELMKQARGAKSVQELRTMANECGIEMSAESAGKYYAALHSHDGVVADDELANVTGGCGGGDKDEIQEPVVPPDSLFEVEDRVLICGDRARIWEKRHNGMWWLYNLQIEAVYETGHKVGDMVTGIPEDMLTKC